MRNCGFVKDIITPPPLDTPDTIERVGKLRHHRKNRSSRNSNPKAKSLFLRFLHDFAGGGGVVNPFASSIALADDESNAMRL